jgi:hypothetical protein
MAVAAAVAGDRDMAFAYLEKAFAQEDVRSSLMTSAKHPWPYRLWGKLCLIGSVRSVPIA